MPAERRDPPLLPLLPYMVQWYGPVALAKTGLLTIVSGLFGQYADQRVLQASLDTTDRSLLSKRYDYSKPDQVGLPLDKDGALWVDYIADLGDGFDSTYSMASLLAQPSLKVEGADRDLPAGQILVMGGDEVYPYASESDYKRRFIEPYEMTVWYRSEEERARNNRRLFILPGNHDWYDGLAAFDALFCTRRDGVSEGRVIGPYQCQQHRSYFAIKLPHDWWIWGLDTQLSSNIDVGQIKYFHGVAESMKSSFGKAKIIMCIPEPAWHHGSESGSTESYSANLQRILNLAIDIGKVSMVVAGDWHHYSRYFGLNHRLNLITAGGGGAYLAPTHQLPDHIDVPWVGTDDAAPQMIPFTVRGPVSTDDAAVKAAGIAGGEEAPTAHQNIGPGSPKESIFPTRRTSRRMSWRIPFAPVTRNPSFLIGLGVFYWIMTWLFATALVKPQGASLENCLKSPPEATVTRSVEQRDEQHKRFCTRSTDVKSIILDKTTYYTTMYGYQRPNITIGDYTAYVTSAAVNQIALAAIGVLVFFMLYSFSNARHRTTRALEAGSQWLLHVAAMVFLYESIALVTEYVRNDLFSIPVLKNLPTLGGLTDFTWHLISAGLMLITGGFLGGIIWGVYLFLANRVFRTQSDMAFAILRVADYKNFLRMRITPDELTIYPIALSRVPWRTGWRKTNAEDRAKGVVAAYLPMRPLKPRLIEGPVVIRPDEVRDLQPGPKLRYHERAIANVAKAARGAPV